MQRLSMRKIREALRLRADGLSGRQVAQSLSLGRATVSEYFRRAEVAGLDWPLPDDLSDVGQTMFVPSSKRWLQRGRGWFTSFALVQANELAMS